ncbi:MAG: O-antigen ligase family protein [Patescibacteria group bacterium]
MFFKILKFLTLAFIFLLPWQTRWIYGSATLNNLPWEYGTLSFYGTEILLWLIVILTGIRVFGKKTFWQRVGSRENFNKRWPFILIGAAIAIYGICSYVSLPVAVVSGQFMSRAIGAICLSICLALSEIKFSKMALVFWLSGVGQGILAIMQFFTQKVVASKWLGLAAHTASDTGASVVQTATERVLRAYGSFGWPNSLGVFLAVALIIGVIIFANAHRRFWPYLIAGQMIVFIGLIFTFSRGAWLALIIGLLLCLIIYLKQKNKFACLILAKQIIAFALITVVLLIAYFPLFNARASADNYLEQLSLNERTTQYQIARDIIFKHPLIGVGPGLYTYYLAGHYVAPTYGTYQPVHNISVLALAELGVFMFLGFVALVIWFAVRIWKTNPIYLSVVIALLVAGMFDHFLWSLYAGQILFWVVLGMGVRVKSS